MTPSSWILPAPRPRARGLGVATPIVLALSSLPSPGGCQRSDAADSLLTVTANVESAEAVFGHSVIELTLSRLLTANDGDLLIVIGGVDVSPVVERTGRRIVYRPGALPLPEGNTDLVLYRRSAGKWTELRRIVLNVLSKQNATRLSATPSATLGNKGQIAEGRSEGIPIPDRRTFQDFVLNAGLQSSRAWSSWSMEAQSNYVGVSRQQEALRFGTHGAEAPKLDLSNYLVVVRGPTAVLSLGHVSFGASRHLANSFTARGGSVVLSRGPTTLTAGALGGSSQVGWSDLVGFNRRSNRVLGASLARELVPSRPGSLRVDVTLLDGSVLPQTSFSQGAIVDAEESRGGSVQLTAASPGQRVRFVGGYTRSRFENPRRDAQLIGDTTVQIVQPVTRGARFLEANVTLLQNAQLPIAGPANVTLGWRHERVDPLFRSVTAPSMADRQQHSADANASIGVVTAQFSTSWTRDNLADIESILRTNGRAGSASIAVPMGALLRAGSRSAWWPMITAMVNHTHQFADHAPSSVFRPQDVPDQLSTNSDASALWQKGRWRMTLRVNRSAQDNRQLLREQADFVAGVRAASLGVAIGGKADVAIDLGDEYQTALERDETTRGRRVTMNATVRPSASTNLIAALSIVQSKAPAGSITRNVDQRAELSRSVRVWRDGAAPRGQLFLRYARTTSLLPSFAPASPGLNQRQWAIASGVNLRLF